MKKAKRQRRSSSKAIGEGELKRLPSGVWVYRYWNGEKRVQRSTKTDDLAKAKVEAREWQNERDKRAVPAKPTRHAASGPRNLRLREMLAILYEHQLKKHGRVARWRVKPILDDLGETWWSDLNRAALMDWFQARLDGENGAWLRVNTVANDLRTLKTAQNVCLRNGHLDPAFATDLKDIPLRHSHDPTCAGRRGDGSWCDCGATDRDLPTTEGEVWSDEEFWAVHAHLPFYLQQVFEFLFITGWRHYSECLNLTYVGNLDLDTRRLRLFRTKEKRPRERFLDPEPPLAALIDRQMEWTIDQGRDPTDPAQAIFHSPTEYKTVMKRGQQIKSWGHAYKTAMKAAGVTRYLRPHDLRHTAATRMYEAGIGFEERAALMGHHSLKMQEKYQHARGPTIAAAQETLAAMVTRGRVRAA